MRTILARSVAVGLMVTVGVVLSACSGQNGAAPATTTVTATPQSPSPQQSMGKPQQTASKAKVDATGSDVNCSTNGGKVGPKGGKQVDLIAVATPAGTVGCTEAFNVISDYYRDAPTKSEGTAHVLTVQGWKCLTDTGAQGSGIIGCDKGGLAFHTGQS